MATKAETTALMVVTGTGIEAKPGTITLEGAKEFAKAVQELAKRYEGYTVTAETYKQDKDVRAELNKFLESIDRKRIDAKNEIMAPVAEFEKALKESLAPLVKVRDDIKEQIAEFEQQVKELRASAVRSVFEQLAEAGGLDVASFEVYFANFTKAEYFKKDKPELTNKAIAEINAIFDQEVKRLEEVAQARATIEQMAQTSNLSAGPYLTLYDRGESLPSVLQAITDDMQRKAQEEAERQAREVAEAERRAQIEQQAQQQAQARYSVVDNETGEVLDAPPVNQSKQPARLVLEMDFEDISEIKELKAWLEARGTAYKQISAQLL